MLFNYRPVRLLLRQLSGCKRNIHRSIYAQSYRFRAYALRIVMATVLLILVVVMVSVEAVSVDVKSKTSSLSSVTSHDMDLIKLYLEEFRLELMSVKSQLARMARNSKLVRTSLKELRTSKCLHSEKDISLGNCDLLLGYFPIDWLIDWVSNLT